MWEAIETRALEDGFIQLYHKRGADPQYSELECRWKVVIQRKGEDRRIAHYHKFEAAAFAYNNAA